jgi:hypothetical protein
MVKGYKWHGWLEDCPHSFVGLSGRTITDRGTKAKYKGVVTGIEFNAAYVKLGKGKLHQLVTTPDFEYHRYWVWKK